MLILGSFSFNWQIFNDLVYISFSPGSNTWFFDTLMFLFLIVSTVRYHRRAKIGD